MVHINDPQVAMIDKIKARNASVELEARDKGDDGRT